MGDPQSTREVDVTRERRRVPDIVVRDGKPVAVIIPIRDYRDMLKRLGDTDSRDVLRHGLREARGASLEDGLWESPLPKADVLPKLLAICREFTKKAPDGVVFQEPFVPYIPDAWNGVLVLAVAQNLSTAGQVVVREYSTYLKNRTPTGRYWRLYPDKNQGSPLVRAQPDAFGIGPWDRKETQVVVSCLGYDPRHTAVSNGVPWSCRTASGCDSAPTPDMRDAAFEFWCEVFKVWRPARVITFGRIPEAIVQRAGLADRCLYVPFPAGGALGRCLKSLDVQQTLKAYPVIRHGFETLGLTDESDWATRRMVYLSKYAIDAATHKGWMCPWEA